MDAWFAATAGSPPDAVRLFCFAPAGSDASFFGPWRDRLRPEIDVCPVQLPGRGPRSSQTPYTRADELVRDLVTELRRWPDRPYAFFGHSLGAALAYEVACGLAAAEAIGPRALIVSGRRSPYTARRALRIFALPDDEFVAHLVRLGGLPPAVLGRTELYRFLLPALRADFAVDESYAPQRPAPGLSCPVLAVTGTDDPLAGPADLAAWQEVTSGDFAQQAFAGGHFYLRPAPEELFETIRKSVAG